MIFIRSGGKMEDDNLGQGQDNWVNNRSNGGNFTKFIPLNQRQIIISTVNNTDNGVHSAGFWTLKDVIIVSSLTLIIPAVIKTTQSSPALP